MQPNEINLTPQPNQTNTSQQGVGLGAQPKSNKNILKIVGIIFGGLILLLGVYLLVSKFLISKSGGNSNEIVWWGLWEDPSVVSPLISEYETKNPGVKIKYLNQSKEDYRERLANAIAKGTAPDIFRFHNSWVPMFRNELDKMPGSIYSVSEFSKLFYPVMVSDLTIGSGVVGMPLGYDGLTLYINEEIFEKSGKDIPTTWNELRKTARELTVIDEEGRIVQSGVSLGEVANVDHWQEILALMMLQNGADLNKPTGKLAEDAITFFTVFSSSDGVWDSSLPSSTTAFSGGKLAMYFGPSWRAFEIRLQNPNLRFKTVALPQLPKTSVNEPDVSYASYWIDGVWARSKNKAEAWKFLKFLSEKENLEKLYQNSSKLRMFGEVYPRMDMAAELSTHPIVGSIVDSAKFSQSWFLQSKTWDGPTGINSQMGKYFEDAVNAVASGKEASKALGTVSSGVSQVLSQYGITIR